MDRKTRRNRRKHIFAKHKAQYHAGYFKGTRTPRADSAEARALKECEQ